MIEFLAVITMCSLLVPAYVYVGYPAMLWLLTRRRTFRPARQSDMTPPLTLIISCYNEAAVIHDKLVNALSLDYPVEQLQILVVSDGSDDGTDEIVRTFADQGVQLIRQEGRLGKTMGLNLAMEQARGELVVFSDANAMYAPDALRMLVRHFADPAVGYAVGAALYTDSDTGASARSENLYWRYELAIKQMETRLHSVVGGDGAIYAIRRALWQPLQSKDINDFVNPLQIIALGYRGVFDPEARCFEETAGHFEGEIARKERIVNRSIRGLMRVKVTMNPFRVGVFAWQVVSHKLLRWLIPVFLLVAAVGSVLLAMAGVLVFQWLAIFMVACLLLAAAGMLVRDKNRLPGLVSVPYYFAMVNLYALRGILRALSGETQVTWASARPAQKREQE
ncbi:glycosyltransferase family 2 protein [Marinobacter persicus]|uniref:Cellulose synthase/poly-beta-1,6-N-acetylglucosamine synthase-like glycosyltransferase n=1 Tax=Marinobacter persicus TaxID=930118 RepID=A0A2S6G910_9GAMM|nr:glycosyltransferase family 2 protein [Marinobacter persicus]PPK52732.1 cellulose synthase/poly-beta-1,6-N-acetylglucosamine synthase-like glycosyltransferase [Marinobacter persicus]PPK55722.1 cellulose synthase/poly-beta-1,6-N-acetylglucosamine synthase-like glycosyltransferase [Marinobacter persicus]PPK59243.1 cellulose synthase/poly-beta-1,6-N-acetylglucosamine synthase-like glycosyltransferase [Marinobacter persicus]